MFAFPQPHYMPCVECGASVGLNETELHVCELERRLDYTLFQLRDELQHFDEQLTTYLDSSRGRFETWYAAKRRRDDL